MSLLISSGTTTVEADDYGDLFVSNTDTDPGSSAQVTASDANNRRGSIDSQDGFTHSDDVSGQYGGVNKQFLSLASSTDEETLSFGHVGVLVTYDNTHGAAKVRFSAFDSNGDTVTAEIALT